MSGDLRVAVVGLGAMGRIHVGCLGMGITGARLAAVVDLDIGVAEALAAEHKVPTFDSVDRLLSRAEIDALVVATPAETHAEIVEAAAAAGKHVLCEKPLDCHLEPMGRALAAVESSGVVLQVGFQRRFDRTFRHLQEQVAEVRAGDIVTIHLISRDPVLTGPPRMIDGMSSLFFDTTVHDFDMLRYLTGAEIAMVHVRGSSRIHGQRRIDTALILVEMTNGVAATIDNSQAIYGYDQRVEVFGTAGLLAATNETEDSVWAADASGGHTPRRPYFFAQRYAKAYVEQMRAFAEAVTRGIPVAASGADGRAATLAALAAQRSLDLGRPVQTSEVAQGS